MASELTLYKASEVSFFGNLLGDLLGDGQVTDARVLAASGKMQLLDRMLRSLKHHGHKVTRAHSNSHGARPVHLIITMIAKAPRPQGLLLFFITLMPRVE